MIRILDGYERLCCEYWRKFSIDMIIRVFGVRENSKVVMLSEVRERECKYRTSKGYCAIPVDR